LNSFLTMVATLTCMHFHPRRRPSV
jgi:hypothetical protein